MVIQSMFFILNLTVCIFLTVLIVQREGGLFINLDMHVMFTTFIIIHPLINQAQELKIHVHGSIRLMVALNDVISNFSSLLSQIWLLKLHLYMLYHHFQHSFHLPLQFALVKLHSAFVQSADLIAK